MFRWRRRQKHFNHHIDPDGRLQRTSCSRGRSAAEDERTSCSRGRPAAGVSSHSKPEDCFHETTWIKSSVKIKHTAGPQSEQSVDSLTSSSLQLSVMLPSTGGASSSDVLIKTHLETVFSMFHINVIFLSGSGLKSSSPTSSGSVQSGRGQVRWSI